MGRTLPATEVAVTGVDPVRLLRPRRRIVGMSAVLLPFDGCGSVDWKSFERLVGTTVRAGLVPAVNMDTGFGPLLDEETRGRVLRIAQGLAGERGFVAGAIVADRAGDSLDLAGYRRATDEIAEHGGMPVIVQSYGLTGLRGRGVVEAYERIAEFCERFIAFELGRMFAPFGAVYDLETYEGIVRIPGCVGAKHSSLDRVEEWRRLELRNRVRPDFMVLTGNDLAIDMVMYGSDYLLGLATFWAELFARRDAMWANGDPSFHAINDRLQYLGQFAFRAPVPAYRHSAAQFLKLRGLIACDTTHPMSPRRPESDLPILRQIAEELEGWS